MLSSHARPLNDMTALEEMIGSARIVGLGEAGHSAHEFFTLKHRLFRHLAETKGFTTFVLEASWSTGLRLNDYVTNGVGDPEQIMREEFQGQYVFWNTQEYLDLLHWMREHNAAGRPRLRFAGNDLGYPGREAFDQVVAGCPELAERLTELYAPLRPGTTEEAGRWMFGQLTKEQPLRQADADRARAALDLVREHGGSAWARQNATAIAQSFTAYAYPDEQFPERMRYRDRIMADNTAWLLDHTGGKILLAAGNGHVAYTSDHPDEFPEPAGAFLRERLGADYVSIGLTFNQGTVNALPDFTAQEPRVYTVPPAPPGHNEHVLDQVPFRDFALDLRTVPDRDWFETARPTRSYGLYWSADDPKTALAGSYDLLVHLHQVEAGHLLTPAGGRAPRG
ncbi:erythromycin esterase family protein [Nonomuraea sp. MTCD27]|uniref:erythromycin esterase family protein n=1 Tax=Nonomuraea sp. MTCD27 TaxID=1676747 RepID=UPI0035C1567C